MNIEAMKQAFDALLWVGHTTRSVTAIAVCAEATDALRQAIEQAEKQEPAVEHLWECLGRWSSYLAVNGTEANLAPPNWLLDAVIAATSQPRKEWVGLTDEEILSAAEEVPITCIRQRDYDLHFAPIIEAKLKEKNGG
jgi:hypothetical protein